MKKPKRIIAGSKKQEPKVFERDGKKFVEYAGIEVPLDNGGSIEVVNGVVPPIPLSMLLKDIREVWINTEHFGISLELFKKDGCVASFVHNSKPGEWKSPLSPDLFIETLDLALTSLTRDGRHFDIGQLGSNEYGVQIYFNAWVDGRTLSDVVAGAMELNMKILEPITKIKEVIKATRDEVVRGMKKNRKNK